jgi:hypothetical protein
MKAIEFLQQGDTVRTFVMRALRAALTEARTDGFIDKLRIGGFLGGFIRRGIDALMPERFLAAIDWALAQAFPGDTQ